MATLQPDPCASAPVAAPASAWAPPGWLLPIALVILLTSAWTVQHWPALSAGQLPDTDDMMRLAQIRDWIGGQPFSDLSQHRLGPGGLAMHWSRIGDVGPAALILLAEPAVGMAAAERAAVILWPALLFMALLFLVRRIALHLEGPATVSVATVLAALAYPTTGYFMPGRIDHHGLQAVLLALTVAALTAPATTRSGLVAGAAIALSLALGLEAAPLLLTGMAALGVAWVLGGTREDMRVSGFAAGLSITLAALLVLLRPAAWPDGWCDALTPAAARAFMILIGAWCMLSIAGIRWKGRRARLVIASVIGMAMASGVWLGARNCLAGPYALVDPFVARIWLDNVAEAGPLLGAGGIGLAWAQGGLGVMGIVAFGLRLRTDRDIGFGWALVGALLIVGMAGTAWQIRSSFLVAMLAVVPLTWMVTRARAAREGRASALIAGCAWLASAGLVHALAGQAVAARSPSRADPPGASCTSAATLRAVAALPNGLVAAPMDAGAYLIGGTRHRVLAAPYHRNNAGNRALYDLLLSGPDVAARKLRALGVDYLLFCTADTAELRGEPAWPASLAAALTRGRTPVWLDPAPAPVGISLFRVRDAS